MSAPGTVAEVGTWHRFWQAIALPENCPLLHPRVYDPLKPQSQLASAAWNVQCVPSLTLPVQVLVIPFDALEMKAATSHFAGQFGAADNTPLLHDLDVVPMQS